MSIGVIFNIHFSPVSPFVSFSQTPMKNAKALIGDAGATFENAVSVKVDEPTAMCLAEVC